MPTFGWIQEDAIERFWENPYPPDKNDPPEFPCPYCSKVFTATDALHEHLGLAHPIDLPVLRLRSREIGTELVIRTEVDLADVQLLNCTHSRFAWNHGRSAVVGVGRVPALFASQASAVLDLILSNRRKIDHNDATIEITVQFRIPKLESLNRIDGLFVTDLAVEHPSMSDIDSFRRECPSEPESTEYAGALADYAIGLAIKEGHPESGTRSSFQDYKEKFATALEILREFRRPVPNAVASVIAFNLNNFSNPPLVKGLAALGEAFSFYRDLATGHEPEIANSPETVRDVQAICPVDIVTHRILDLLPKVTATRRPHPLILAELLEILGWNG